MTGFADSRFTIHDSAEGGWVFPGVVGNRESRIANRESAAQGGI